MWHDCVCDWKKYISWCSEQTSHHIKAWRLSPHFCVGNTNPILTNQMSCYITRYIIFDNISWLGSLSASLSLPKFSTDLTGTLWTRGWFLSTVVVVNAVLRAVWTPVVRFSGGPLASPSLHISNTPWESVGCWKIIQGWMERRRSAGGSGDG